MAASILKFFNSATYTEKQNDLTIWLLGKLPRGDQYIGSMSNLRACDAIAD